MTTKDEMANVALQLLICRVGETSCLWTRDEAATWQCWRQCDGRSRGRSKKPWKKTNMLAGHLPVDWSIGW